MLSRSSIVAVRMDVKRIQNPSCTRSMACHEQSETFERAMYGELKNRGREMNRLQEAFSLQAESSSSG